MVSNDTLSWRFKMHLRPTKLFWRKVDCGHLCRTGGNLWARVLTVVQPKSTVPVKTIIPNKRMGFRNHNKYCSIHVYNVELLACENKNRMAQKSSLRGKKWDMYTKVWHFLTFLWNSVSNRLCVVCLSENYYNLGWVLRNHLNLCKRYQGTEI